MEKILVSYGINKARYHCGTLEGISIQKLLQNANGIFTDFKEEIKKMVTDKSILKIVDEVVVTLKYALYLILYFPFREHHVVK